MTSVEKEEIIKSILTNDNTKALSYLYTHLRQKVRKYIVYNSGSKEEADDVFQDAVIIFIHQVKTEKFEHNSDIEGFIFVIAKNLWLNIIRRENRFQKYIDNFDDNEKIVIDNQLKVLLDKEKSEALESAFNKLDEKCQKILNYFIYEKLSMKEICKKMGYASDNVAKTNHYRCKKYLSNIVKNDPYLYNILKE